MNIYSFKNLTRDVNQNNLYDLFPTQVAFNIPINLYTDTVRREEHMRADLVCKRLYGTTSIIEEFLKVNNLMNIWSVYENDSILYFMYEDLNKLYYKEPVNTSKNTKKDPNRNLPPSIKPSSGTQQVTINKNSKKIQIINSFQ
jgi:hypothetical protein